MNALSSQESYRIVKQVCLKRRKIFPPPDHLLSLNQLQTLPNLLARILISTPRTRNTMSFTLKVVIPKDKKKTKQLKKLNMKRHSRNALSSRRFWSLIRGREVRYILIIMYHHLAQFRLSKKEARIWTRREDRKIIIHIRVGSYQRF